MSADSIKLKNLTNEATHAFDAGQFRKAALLLAEAHILAVNVVQVEELVTNEKAVTRMTA